MDSAFGMAVAKLYTCCPLDPAMTDNHGSNCILQAIRGVLRDIPARKVRVLDVGCGRGLIPATLVRGAEGSNRLETAKRIEYRGLDGAATALAALQGMRYHYGWDKHLSSFDAFIADATEGPYRSIDDLPYDLVACYYTLHALPIGKVAAALGYMSQAAAGGLVSIVDYSTFPPTEEEAFGVGWRDAELNQILVAAGVSVTSHDAFVSEGSKCDQVNVEFRGNAEYDFLAAADKEAELLDAKFREGLVRAHALSADPSSLSKASNVIQFIEHASRCVHLARHPNWNGLAR